MKEKQVKKCLWCQETAQTATFEKKAHTIPLSLGGQNYNPNVCDLCNHYFGNRSVSTPNYSIEEALKETFVISRYILMGGQPTKRKVGKFKSKFFELKFRKGRPRLVVKQSFRFNSGFQAEICRIFKRGLYKMFLEEFNRQKNLGFGAEYDIIRQFARYDQGDLPVLYFVRTNGIIASLKNEFETPVLIFDRMNYLYSSHQFVEIEFLGHVFGLPITSYTSNEFSLYLKNSFNLKKGFFKQATVIRKLSHIDLTLKIFSK